jgi:hypothetical protein
MRVARVLQVLRGSTSPALAETEDGALFVLKFSGAGPGPKGLLIEFIATRMVRALGVHAPEPCVLRLPDGFPWQAGTDEFDAMLQRSYGENLGLAFVPDARIALPEEIASAPSAELDAIAAADALLHNVDRCAANPNLMIDAARALWAIDHDACLFLDRALAGRAASGELPQGHLLEGRAVPPLKALDAAALLDGAPEGWIESTGRSRAEIVAALARYVSSATVC